VGVIRVAPCKGNVTLECRKKTHKSASSKSTLSLLKKQALQRELTTFRSNLSIEYINLAKETSSAGGCEERAAFGFYSIIPP
jgi:hypothetical protein